MNCLDFNCYAGCERNKTCPDPSFYLTSVVPNGKNVASSPDTDVDADHEPTTIPNATNIAIDLIKAQRFTGISTLKNFSDLRKE